MWLIREEPHIWRSDFLLLSWVISSACSRACSTQRHVPTAHWDHQFVWMCIFLSLNAVVHVLSSYSDERKTKTGFSIEYHEGINWNNAVPGSTDTSPVRQHLHLIHIDKEMSQSLQAFINLMWRVIEGLGLEIDTFSMETTSVEHYEGICSVL